MKTISLHWSMYWLLVPLALLLIYLVATPTTCAEVSGPGAGLFKLMVVFAALFVFVLAAATLMLLDLWVL